MPGKIRNVPMLPGMHVEHFNFLQELRNAVLQLQSSNIPPDDPRNLTVSPVALGNNIQFTRSSNAQRYTLYISSSPTSAASSPQGSIAVDLGDSNNYTDVIGQANYTRYYWVRAWNGNQSSRLVGPVGGKTGAAGSTVNPPKQVPPGVVGIDESTGLTITGNLSSIPGKGPVKK